jgi:hypothetical protein
MLETTFKDFLSQVFLHKEDKRCTEHRAEVPTDGVALVEACARLLADLVKHTIFFILN